MNPKQGKPTPNAQAMFKSAFVFEEASRIIHNEMWNNKKMRLAVTYAVNASFAVELYLKCLLVIEHNAAPPDQHNLKELFRLLPRHTKRQLTREHDEWAKKDETFQNVLKHFPDKKCDLDSFLDEAQDAFTQFRYAHEGLREGVGFSLNGFIYFLKKRILKKHPDWEHW